jgi:hypothetical protein
MKGNLYKYKFYITALVTIWLLQMPGVSANASNSFCTLPPDTIKTPKKVVKPKVHFQMADSIDSSNKKKARNMEKSVVIQDKIKMDSLNMKKVFTPDPIKATWLAMLIPGGGQIYNRKFWKLPIVYGGLAGCAYALSWNSKTYKDYAQAYRDIMDDNPNTTSYKQLLPNGSSYSTTQLSSILKKRKDLYRRYRDMSIFAVIGVYVLSIIDAYVDAELSNFDISPNLSMRVEPVIMNNNSNNNNYTSNSLTSKAIGIQCGFKF